MVSKKRFGLLRMLTHNAGCWGLGQGPRPEEMASEKNRGAKQKCPRVDLVELQSNDEAIRLKESNFD